MNYLWFFLLFYGSLGLGLLCAKGRPLAGLIMRLTILFVDTPLFLYSFWILDLAKVRHYAPIPLIAAALVLIPLGLTPMWAKRLFLHKTAQGSFVLASSFSNIGTTGGAFICYLLYGLPGLSLAYLFLLPYPVLIFTLGFSAAKHYACDCRLTLKDYLLNIMSNLFSLLPLVAIAAGLALNLGGHHPAKILASLADIWIKLGLGSMCFAIGMTLELEHVFKAAKPIAALSAIKFVILPCLAILTVLLVYGSVSGMESKITIIQSAMPPAIYAVITANLFGLDRTLVNSLWFSTTLFLIPIAGLIFMFF